MIGAALGEAGGDHVAVADGLDLLTPSRSARSSKAEKVRLSISTSSAGLSIWLSSVKPTRSAKSTVTSAKPSAMASPFSFNRAEIAPGRMFRKRRSDRSCSSARRASARVVSAVKRWMMNTTVAMTQMAEEISMASAAAGVIATESRELPGTTVRE